MRVVSEVASDSTICRSSFKFALRTSTGATLSCENKGRNDDSALVGGIQELAKSLTIFGRTDVVEMVARTVAETLAFIAEREKK